MHLFRQIKASTLGICKHHYLGPNTGGSCKFLGKCGWADVQLVSSCRAEIIYIFGRWHAEMSSVPEAEVCWTHLVFQREGWLSWWRRERREDGVYAIFSRSHFTESHPYPHLMPNITRAKRHKISLL